MGLGQSGTFSRDGKDRELLGQRAALADRTLRAGGCIDQGLKSMFAGLAYIFVKRHVAIIGKVRPFVRAGHRLVMIGSE